jgi:hypothetical protein
LKKKILIKLSEIVEIFKKLKWKGLLGHPVDIDDSKPSRMFDLLFFQTQIFKKRTRRKKNVL